MKCPWCGNEMEDGFIGITGELFDVSWYRDPTVLGLKGEPIGGWGLLAQNHPGRRCLNCRIVILQY
jgi:hypothetical protein